MILIRHGYTGYPNGTFVGRSDVPLARDSVKEAEVFGERLRHEGVERLYTSCMKRAIETGEAIGRALGLGISGRLKGINEIDFGDWEMSWWEDFRKENPDDYRKRKADPWSFDKYGMESWGQVRDRAMPVIRELLERNEGKTIAVVCHGVTMRIIYSVLAGLTAEQVNGKAYPFLCALFFKKHGDKIELEKAWDVHEKL
jgi:broad specificity phosphatase PhoE